MKMGQCYQCGTKIGRTSVNGGFRYGPKFRQIHMLYRLDNGKETKVHIPVCAECSEKPDHDKVMLGMNESPELKSFLKLKPTFVSFGLDPIG